MGGGNGQKAAMARAKAAEKAKKNQPKGAASQLKTNAAANSIVCTICRSTFIVTSTEAKLKEHVENKHDKKTFAECFPGWTKQ
eukprot:scaffold3.g6208.t1